MCMVSNARCFIPPVLLSILIRIFLKRIALHYCLLLWLLPTIEITAHTAHRRLRQLCNLYVRMLQMQQS